MLILAWLGVPVVATLLAIGWTHWATRPRRPMEIHESVAAHERFRAAITGSASRSRR